MTATATRERPILFTGEMVRAILEGRKTQTRRVAKFTPGGHVKEPGGHRRWHPGDPDAALACPYGQPGDRLWVREKHRYGVHPDLLDAIEYVDGAWRKPTGLDEETGHRFSDRCDQGMGGWRPSIHMPRWASRITLEITAVRVERVQAITEADARAEGTEPRLLSDTSGPSGREQRWRTSGGVFHDLRDSINAKRGHGWDTNPWVWVVEFKVVTA